MAKPRRTGRGLGVALVLALGLGSCGSGKEGGGLANEPSRSLAGQATAVVYLGDANRATDRYLTGPDELAVSGPALSFHTPWEAWRPRQYRVPAGVVKFSLRDRSSRGTAVHRFGFEAVAGELYQVRYDPDTGVAVEEVGSGRVARGKVKRLLENPAGGM